MVRKTKLKNYIRDNCWDRKQSFNSLIVLNIGLPCAFPKTSTYWTVCSEEIKILLFQGPFLFRNTLQSKLCDLKLQFQMLNISALHHCCHHAFAVSVFWDLLFSFHWPLRLLWFFSVSMCDSAAVSSSVRGERGGRGLGNRASGHHWTQASSQSRVHVSTCVVLQPRGPIPQSQTHVCRQKQ